MSQLMREVVLLSFFNKAVSDPEKVINHIQTLVRDNNHEAAMSTLRLAFNLFEQKHDVVVMQRLRGLARFELIAKIREYNQLASICMKSHDYEGANKAYDKLIETADEFVKFFGNIAHATLAKAYRKRGEFYSTLYQLEGEGEAIISSRQLAISDLRKARLLFDNETFKAEIDKQIENLIESIKYNNEGNTSPRPW